MDIFQHPSFDQHDKIHIVTDDDLGMVGIIAIHRQLEGTAIGGCRRMAYESEAEAFNDVLRLSMGMSYKSVMAGLTVGGAKSVIFQKDMAIGRDEAITRMAHFIHELGGCYSTAVDVGISADDVRAMAEITPYALGAKRGDPSPHTAYGVYLSLKAAVRCRLGRDDCDDLDQLKIGVIGVGKVGWGLAEYLTRDGAQLIVADINKEVVDQAIDQFGATSMSVDEMMISDCDVIAPCALGGLLHEMSVAKLQAKVICGGANNQLLSNEDGQRLADREILYVPDYIANAGGLISVACEYYDEDDAWVSKKIEDIPLTLNEVFTQSIDDHVSTVAVANMMAEQRMKTISERLDVT